MGGDFEMPRKATYEQDNAVQIKLPWDENTAKGFGIALAITFLFLLIAPSLHYKNPSYRNIQINSVPLTLLNFGDGDGTGLSKGNLTAEGMQRKGGEASSILQDAESPSITRFDKNVDIKDPMMANPVPVSELSSDAKTKGTDKGEGRLDIGVKDGSTDGSGLGSRGSGKGKGLGFGDIEWGGGGNRIVLQKPLPKFPVGVNTNAELKFKFTVLPDGSVGRIIPLQKADPRLEAAAMDALRQWRFNRLNSDIIMEGIIPLTFILR